MRLSGTEADVVPPSELYSTMGTNVPWLSDKLERNKTLTAELEISGTRAVCRDNDLTKEMTPRWTKESYV